MAMPEVLLTSRSTASSNLWFQENLWSEINAEKAMEADQVESLFFGSRILTRWNLQLKQSAPFLRTLDDLQSANDVKTINGDASVEHRWNQNNDETRSSSISQRTSLVLRIFLLFLIWMLPKSRDLLLAPDAGPLIHA
ncbi:hypothetical protein HPP92_018558 [Vanilla planifolia]|uniref:Uncharacterized protein n=1 Tax=Vanilla planifolia TaxID=51239 RepID=A0A835Q910_VANPL|nr:hypothetical protein HPP92_018558 [Vanilla planifolia]